MHTYIHMYRHACIVHYNTIIELSLIETQTLKNECCKESGEGSKLLLK